MGLLSVVLCAAGCADGEGPACSDILKVNIGAGAEGAQSIRICVDGSCETVDVQDIYSEQIRYRTPGGEVVPISNRATPGGASAEVYGQGQVALGLAQRALEATVSVDGAAKASTKVRKSPKQEGEECPATPLLRFDPVANRLSP